MMRILGTISFIVILVIVLSSSKAGETNNNTQTSVTMLTFGDTNLGRYVGKVLLQGDTLYPFRRIRQTLAEADIVFLNLESQLSDQKGETQSKKNNLIFTGPPEGGASLAQAGITIVSTANNHAYDYGFRALKETIENLDSSNIWHVGTGIDSNRLYKPLRKRISGITFAFFAVTELMNTPCCAWKPYVAWVDSGRLFPEIRAIRDSADVIIVSYHGNEEYKDAPTREQQIFFHQCIDRGVDIVVGHHSHVFQGIEKYKSGWCVYSLGNFVFAQPQRRWTQRSAGIRWKFEKEQGKITIRSIDIIPIRAGFQPSETDDAQEREEILDRIHRLSNVRFPWSYKDSLQIH
jgi:poly-gamma-glutamate capsule biosynthesis protein CapA/YwtB (metallophosphatase superfamily)